MNCLTALAARLMHGCTTARQEERWIEINGPESNGKRNKPAERLYEVKSFCRCGREVARAYFTPAELDDYDRKRGSHAQSLNASTQA